MRLAYLLKAMTCIVSKVVSLNYLSGIHLNQRCLDVFGGYLGSQSLKYGAKILI